MTHEALRALLPRYAAGELPERDADAVRTHLASGCTVCLDDVYSRPVGLPVPPRGGRLDGARPEARPATGGEPVATTGALVPVLAGLLALTLLILGACVWLIAELQAREAARAREVDRLAARLSDVEARRTELETRLDALAAELQAARAEAEQQAAAARAGTEATAELARQLEAAETRIATLTRGVRRRDVQIDRLLSGVEEERALRDLLAAPGLELLRLQAVPPFVDGRGHVLSHPARGRVLVYAFGLPTPPSGATYRLRIALADGRTVAGPAFAPDPRGDAVVPVRVDGTAGHVARVEVILEPGARAVLAGRAPD